MSRILLVDDEIIVRKVIGAQLGKLGHTVFTAASAEEARAVFSENSMDMAFVDLRLGNQSGIDLLQVFKEHNPDCQIVLITGYASTETAIEAMRLGASDYLVKPVRSHELVRVVERCLEHKRVLEENRRLEEENRQHREHLEEKVREQTAKIADGEQRFRAIFETIPDLYYRTDMEGRVTNVSPSCLHLTGYSPEEIIGTDITTYYADPNQCDALLQALQKNRLVNDFEVELVRKDGTYRIVSVTAHLVFDRENQPVAVEGIARDITERKHAEIEVRQSEEKYRVLMQNAADAIFIADAETGILIDTNQSAENLIGRQREEMIGMHQSKLHPEDEIENYTKLFRHHVESGGGVVAVPVYVQHRDGRRIPVEISSGVAEVDGKQILLSIFRDATKRKQAEKILQMDLILLRF